ncbi:MAG: hypothetical protein AB1696_05255 [Planctomycetota bacterium]
MKRLVLIVPLLCLAADGPEIEGWKVFNGKWTGTTKDLHSSTGTIVWGQEAKKSIEFSFKLRIANFGSEGKGVVALFWGWPSDDRINSERNSLLVYPHKVFFCDSRQPSGMQKFDYDWSLDKTIQIKGKILPKSGQIMVGTNKLVCNKLNGLGPFALHVNGAEAYFSDIVVKTR